MVPRFALALLVVAMLAAPALAQQPSTTNNVFYGKVDCGGPKYGLSTVAESAGTNCGTSAGTSQTWVLPEDPPIEVDLLIEKGADVPMSVWVGSNTHGGRVDVTSTIYTGSTVVATASGSAQYVGAAGTTYVEVAMKGPAQVSEITEPLRWEVTASGAFSSIYMRFEEGRWSRFALPITGIVGGAAEDVEVAPAITYENLTAPPRVDMAFDEPTTHTYIYNWTHGEAAGALEYAFAGNGSVSASVVDGNGTVVAVGLLNGTGQLPFADAAPGPWSLVLSLENVTGSMQLRFVEAPAPPPADGNATGGPNGTAPEAKDTPLPVALAIAALAWAVRRRR